MNPYNSIPYKLIRFLILLFISFLILESSGLPAVKPAEIVSVRPGAHIYEKKRRQDASVGRDVFKDTLIETDRHGRLSLLLPDHALLKIGSSTRFVYKGMEGEARNWFLDKGKVWLRGLFKRVPFNVRTPTAVIGVRGTEWYMTVAPDGTTTVGVVDGKVQVKNPLGSLFLESREMALVQPGRPPIKSAYLTPENAVNWTLKYRGLWDQADLDRAGKELGTVIQGALKAYHQNDLATGFDLLKETRTRYGTSAPWMALAGFLELVSGNDLDARQYFNAAAEADSSWALPAANLALMNLVENKRDVARKEAEKALRLQSDSAVAMIAMAYILKAELKLEEAYKMTQKAILRSPDFDQVLIVAATIALEMEDLKGCRKILDRLSEDLSVAADRATLYGFLFLRESKNKQAVSRFKQAVSNDPEQTDGWLGLGISLFRLNQVDLGMNAMIKAALIAPQVSAYQSYLAKAFFELNLIDEAEASLARAKRLDPKDPTPHLYESLWLNEIHRPGEAIQSLERARKLNNNRAVFRSRYLLDQDQAVLMSNVSRIYSRLGFDQTSIQEAAQALTINPANEAAHRRLYFALAFDPSFYQQAAVSELLLSKLFVPPTKNAVVFNEDSLKPYQEMFERSGFDTTLSGGYFRSADQDSETKNPSGTVSLAGKLDPPMAFHAQISPSRNETETKIETTTSSGGFTNQYTQRLDQDQNTLFSSLFVKWQPTPVVGIFLDGRFVGVDVDLAGEVRNSMLANAIPVSESQTTSSGETEVKTGDFDGGVNVDVYGGLRGLFHVSYHNDLAKGDTITETKQAFYSSDHTIKFDQDGTDWIVQGALWKNWANHFFQLGLRYYTRDSETLSVTEGAGFTTEFYQPEEYDFTSGFFYHTYRMTDMLTWQWGISVDRSDYVSYTQHKADRTTANPVVGMTWDVHPNWRIRAAYIQNMVGDRRERIQPSMIAGFPYFRVSQIDAFTEEQLLQLQHKTSVVGLDYQFTGFPVFCGFEASYDRVNSRHFYPPGSDTLTQIESDVYGLLSYIEALITPDFSTSLAYRYTDYEYPNDDYESRVDWKAAYFFRNGLTCNLHGIFKNKRPNTEELGLSTRETWTIEPSIDWYLLNNKLRLTLVGHLEEQITNTWNDSGAEDRNTFRWIRAAITVYF